MAQVTPPDNLPNWATDGGAETTDPGASKRATGFITAEAPAAGHMNHQLKQVGEWVAYMEKSTAPDRFLMNLQQPSGNKWSTISVLDSVHIRWIDSLGKYLALFSSQGNNTFAVESTDGVTWVNETDLGASESSKIAYDGTNIVVIVGESTIYTSTTGSVADLTYRDTFTNLRTGWDLVFDEANGYLIAGGHEYIQSCLITNDITDETNWVQRKDYGADFINGLAVSPTGITKIMMHNGGMSSSDDGLTFSAVSADTDIYSCPVWSPATESFMMYNVTDSLLSTTPNNTTNVGYFVSIDCDRLVVTENFTMGVGPGGSGIQPVYFFTSPVGATGLTMWREVTYNSATSNTFIESDLGELFNDTYGATYIIECIGNAPCVTWTAATADDMYSVIR